MKKTEKNKYLPYGRQHIDANDIQEVVSVLESDYLTTGKKTIDFEIEFSKKVNVKYAVSCSSGTAALHLSLLAQNLPNESRVIVPAISFLATANIVELSGGKVVFADVDSETGVLSESTITKAIENTGDKISAIIPVHLNDSSLDMKMIRHIADQHNLKVIEDACHALGGNYYENGKITGVVGSNLYSDLTSFSLHPVKAIAMGEGGVITTNSEILQKKILRLRNHGMTRNADDFLNNELAFDKSQNPNLWYYEMQELGLNYRASDIHCALGLSQLKKLEKFISKRIKLFKLYTKHLESFSPTIIPVKNNFSVSAPHLFPVLIDFNSIRKSRAELMRLLDEKGIGSQVHYIPLFLHPYYKNKYHHNNYEGAIKYYERCLSLPLYYDMNEDDVIRVTTALQEIIG